MKKLFFIEKEKKHYVIHLLKIKFKIRQNGYFKHKIKRKEKPYDFGIISFNINTDTFNYGAALHSYAFQKYLDKQKISNVIINYYPETVRLTNKLELLVDLYKKKNLSEVLYFIRFVMCLLIKKYKFYNFFKKHCTITKHRYEVDTLEQINSIANFICETDVTWHKFKSGYDRGFMCDLPNMKNKSNLAYSIDFGSKNISEENKNKLKHYAKNFKYISVRNVFKIDYFKEILGRNDVFLSIDPVFLIEEDDYNNIIKAPLEKNFILVYNCKENNPQMVELAKLYAKSKNKNIVIINNYDKNIINFKSCNTSLYSIEEFLGYFKHCDYCFTNSYHGICFSIIFKKTFMCFKRHGNNDKIMTLLELFDLYSQLYEDNKEINNNINYEKVYEKLFQHVKKSKEFLEKSLSIKEF